MMEENSATFSDVEFIVGPSEEKVLGLKALFARASEVFSKMFFEAGFRERTQERAAVRVPDILPAHFSQLRRWVYDLDVQLTPDVALGVLDAAQKYMMEDLERHVRRWIAAASRSWMPPRSI